MRESGGERMTKIQFTIAGVHCKSCKMLIEEELQELGAKDIAVGIDEKKKTGSVSCEYDGDAKKVYQAVKKAGYTVRE